MKKFVGKVVTKSVDFMGDKLGITKLTVEQVKAMQKLSQKSRDAIEKGDNDAAENTSLEVIKHVIRSGCPDSKDLEEGDFIKMPLGDLNQLANDIMEYSGLGNSTPAK